MDTSRRNFLKASTATGLLAMTYATGTLGAVGAKALEGGDRSVFSFCEMCSSRCPIEAKVVDGKACEQLTRKPGTDLAFVLALIHALKKRLSEYPQKAAEQIAG